MEFGKGNTAAVKHGLHGYLTIGRLPKGASYIRRAMGQFRRSLESAVQVVDGEISIVKGALIQSAVRHEVRAQILTRYLNSEKDLALSDRLSLHRDISAASDARDKCLERLKLDYQAADNPWEVIDATTAAAHENGPLKPLNGLQARYGPKAPQRVPGDVEAAGDAEPVTTAEDNQGCDIKTVEGNHGR